MLTLLFEAVRIDEKRYVVCIARRAIATPPICSPQESTVCQGALTAMWPFTMCLHPPC